jgi:hypothetical protein
MPDSDERIHASGEVAWLKKIGQNIYRAGISLKDSTLKPIPIILRMIQAQLSF